MSRSVILKSSIAKKYYMALTGLFLCLFLVGHLLGNLQLLKAGEEGRRAFNEYGYFMTHNIFVKVLSYLTYFSILFHAIDGFLLVMQNKQARPQGYMSNNASANSSFASRNMAMLGTLILVFIVMHMAQFWWKIKWSGKSVPLHAYVKYPPLTNTPTGDTVYYTTKGIEIPKSEMFKVEGNDILLNAKEVEKQFEQLEAQNQMMAQLGQPAQQLPDIKNISKNPKMAEGYKDMHSLVCSFFGQDKKAWGFEANPFALVWVIAYVICMAVLAFHLSHGFSSAFQSMGLRHPAYTKLVKTIGYGFAIIVPLLFAVLPVYLYLTR